MLDALAAGQSDPAALAGLAVGRLRRKHVELLAALQGGVRAHHRLLLRTHLGLIDALDANIAALTAEIEAHIALCGDAGPAG